MYLHKHKQSHSTNKLWPCPSSNPSPCRCSLLMPMFNPNKSSVQEQLNCMSAWVWSIMLCLTDVANTGHWSGQCSTPRDLHADWGWPDEHTLQWRSPHRTQTVLHRTNTFHKWACIDWTGMLGMLQLSAEWSDIILKGPFVFVSRGKMQSMPRREEHST